MTLQYNTLSEQIYQILKEEIITSVLPQGYRITIKELQTKFGISSTPIREALTRLQQDGIIDYRPNVGMSVIVLNKKDVEELYDLMMEFDAIALKYAFSGLGKQKFINELSDVQATAQKYLDEKDIKKWIEYSDRFHLTFYDYANNSRLVVAAERIRLQYSILSNQYQEIDTNRQEIHIEHESILKYISNDNIDMAIKQLYFHETASKEKAMNVLSV